MAKNKFSLVAQVSSERPQAIRPALEAIVGEASIEPAPQGFLVKTTMSGESAKELNKELLSALRRVERKTRLRAQWTSGGITERFFDYVLKGRSDTP
jgi:hypothetical protein